VNSGEKLVGVGERYAIATCEVTHGEKAEFSCVTTLDF
jgi:hypothetical protein